MICPNCKAAADLQASFAAGRPVMIAQFHPIPPIDATAEELTAAIYAPPPPSRYATPAEVAQMVAEGHAACRGRGWCDCQHKARP